MNRILTLFVLALILAGALTAAAQNAPVNPQSLRELNELWSQIQQLKQSDAAISDELYQQFFEAEQMVFPERISEGRERGLDQGMDGCPGALIVQPEPGPMDWVDYGQTYNYYNDCGFPICRPGRDVVYHIQVTYEDSLQITTCGSGFDTWLCIYGGSCCEQGALLHSNDDSDICGPNSLRSGIRACFAPGDYYVVVDGFNATAQGHYQLNVQSLTSGGCGQNPEIVCPPDYLQHEEGPSDEQVCEFGTFINCPARYCGVIGGLGDLDVYYFTLEECNIVTLSVWGNDTPGHSGSGHGLDPIVNLYTTGCESPIYTNDDVIGNPPDITGHDSRLITLCLRPATYWVEVGGDETTGLYEFGYDCDPCDPAAPISGVGREGDCITWPAQDGVTTYYVWLSLSGGPWNLVSTTSGTSYCDDSGDLDLSQYVVFGDPCGQP